NPCAAKKACNPCNPCAAKKACNPCNPCAAKAACNPCNPCAASAADVELTSDEAIALYDCLKPVMAKSYRGGEHWAATKWSKFTKVSTQPYTSATHGGRKVQNLSNKIGLKTYKKFEDIKKMPVGSTLAKPSFTVGADGQANLGPLFIMEKMVKGFNAETADWRYAAILPGGGTMGVTNGANATSVTFCHECHVSGEDNDYLLLVPEEYRVK
ncbi:MAG: cytochrome P460 family protein, partial [Anderseniella sp.]